MRKMRFREIRLGERVVRSPLKRALGEYLSLITEAPLDRVLSYWIDAKLIPTGEKEFPYRVAFSQRILNRKSLPPKTMLKMYQGVRKLMLSERVMVASLGATYELDAFFAFRPIPRTDRYEIYLKEGYEAALQMEKEKKEAGAQGFVTSSSAKLTISFAADSFASERGAWSGFWKN